MAAYVIDIWGRWVLSEWEKNEGCLGRCRAAGKKRWRTIVDFGVWLRICWGQAGMDCPGLHLRQASRGGASQQPLTVTEQFDGKENLADPRLHRAEPPLTGTAWDGKERLADPRLRRVESLTGERGFRTPVQRIIIICIIYCLLLFTRTIVPFYQSDCAPDIQTRLSLDCRPDG
jgi:hypothetical protein